MHEKIFLLDNFLLNLHEHQNEEVLFHHIFLTKGFIEPGVIECSPPNTKGNLLSEIIFLLICDN